jgi:hypothetical protein
MRATDVETTTSETERGEEPCFVKRRFARRSERMRATERLQDVWELLPSGTKIPAFEAAHQAGTRNYQTGWQKGFLINGLARR